MSQWRTAVIGDWFAWYLALDPRPRGDDTIRLRGFYAFSRWPTPRSLTSPGSARYN